MNNIKVSVVMPVYNTSKYLRECMDSVIGQTLKEIEIICVNDGSTDNSLDILMEYAEQDSRIKIITKENSGYGHTINVGFDAAIGEYIGIVESDDYVQKDMMEKLYNVAKSKEVDFVKSNYYAFWGNGEKRTKEKVKLMGGEEIYDKLLSKEQIKSLSKGSIANCTGIYNRNFINEYMIKHNETPGASYQDVGFFFQVIMYASSGYILKDGFYMYRQDNENSSINNKAKVFCIYDEFNYVCEKMNSNPGFADEYNAAFQYLRFKHCQFNFSRIADEFKIAFLQRMVQDLEEDERSGKLDLSFFLSWEKEQLLMMYKMPNKYYEMQMVFSKRVRDVVGNSKKVIIYGAGVKGKEVYKALETDLNKFDYVSFAVTEKKDCMQNKYDVSIRSIYDLADAHKDAVVIVAVTKLYEKQMLEVASSLGFEKIVVLSEVENYG